MGTIAGFKNWINEKYAKLHQELDAELRMMLRKSETAQLTCNWEQKYNNEVVHYFRIVLDEDNFPLFLANIYKEDGSVEDAEFSTYDLSADEIFNIIFNLEE
jgi:hypothetical protein